MKRESGVNDFQEERVVVRVVLLFLAQAAKLNRRDFGTNT
jgi:hypothetical protein